MQFWNKQSEPCSLGKKQSEPSLVSVDRYFSILVFESLSAGETSDVMQLSWAERPRDKRSTRAF